MFQNVLKDLHGNRIHTKFRKYKPGDTNVNHILALYQNRELYKIQAITSLR